MTDDNITDGGSQGKGQDPAGAGASSDRDKHNDAIRALETSGMKVVKADDAANLEKYRKIAMSVQSGELSKKLKEYDAFKKAQTDAATADLSEVERLRLANTELTTINTKLTGDVSMSSLRFGLLSKNLERLLPNADTEKTAVFPDFMEGKWNLLEAWSGEGDVDEFLEGVLDTMEKGQSMILGRYGGSKDTPGSPAVSSGAGRRAPSKSEGSPLLQAAGWKNLVSRKKHD